MIDLNMMVLLQRLSLLAAVHSFFFTVTSGARVLNPVADALSRFQFRKSHRLAPKASAQLTPIPCSLLEELQVF